MRLTLPTLFVETAAIKLSQAKKYTNMWRTAGAPKVWEPLFRKFSADKRAYRIYLPIQAGPIKTPKKIVPPNDVVRALAKLGYTVDDYVAGIAISKDQKRRVRIGKLIANDPEALKSFSNDKRRKTHINDSQAEQNLVVISRHPVDLAGMSTGRGWTSCMNLDTGENRRYVAVDVKLGTLVAYYIKANDKNVSSPIGRVLIKPIKSTKKGDRRLYLVREDAHYGTVTPAFLKTVDAWVAKVNADVGTGTFRLPNALYNDAIDEDVIHVVSFADMKTPKDAAAFLKYAAQPTDAQRAAAVALLDTDVRAVLGFLRVDPTSKLTFPKARAWALDTIRKVDAESAVMGVLYRRPELRLALELIQYMRVAVPVTKYVVTSKTSAQILRMMAAKKDYTTLLDSLMATTSEPPANPSDRRALRSLCVVLLKKAIRLKKRHAGLEAFLQNLDLVDDGDMAEAVQQYAAKFLRNPWRPAVEALRLKPNRVVTPYVERLSDRDFLVVVDLLVSEDANVVGILNVLPKARRPAFIKRIVSDVVEFGSWVKKLDEKSRDALLCEVVDAAVRDDDEGQLVSLLDQDPSFLSFEYLQSHAYVGAVIKAFSDQPLPVVLPILIKTFKGKKMSRDVEAYLVDRPWKPEHLPSLLKLPFSPAALFWIVDAMYDRVPLRPDLVKAFKGTPYWKDYVDSLSLSDMKKVDREAWSRNGGD